MEIEAGAGEEREWTTVAPIKGEEPAGFSGGGAGDGGLLDDGDGCAVLRKEIGGTNSDDSAAAHHHPLTAAIGGFRRGRHGGFIGGAAD